MTHNDTKAVEAASKAFELLRRYHVMVQRLRVTRALDWEDSTEAARCQHEWDRVVKLLDESGY